MEPQSAPPSSALPSPAQGYNPNPNTPGGPELRTTAELAAYRNGLRPPSPPTPPPLQAAAPTMAHEAACATVPRAGATCAASVPYRLGNSQSTYFAFPPPPPQAQQESSRQRREAVKSPSLADLSGESPTIKATPRRRRAAHVALPAIADAAPEPVSRHCDANGYYLARNKETFALQYTLAEMLGQGTFGKVVKAYDMVKREHVAVKIIRNVPKYRDASKLEIRVLRTLMQADPSGSHHCIRLLRAFEFRGHVCMVFPLLPISLFDFMRKMRFQPFPVKHIQRFAVQLLDAAAFLHGRGLIHTDLKPENIMLLSTRVRRASPLHDTALTAADSDAGAAARKRKRDENTASSPTNPTAPHELAATDICLIDFGSAVFSTEYHSAVVSTRHYRAPEIVLGMQWSFPCDLWSIGCILAELYTGRTLFQTHDNVEHLALIERLLGPFPPAFIARASSTVRRDYFAGTRVAFPSSSTSTESRDFVRRTKPLRQHFRDSLKTPLGASALPRLQSGSACSADSVLTLFSDLVRSCLDVDPRARPTAAATRQHGFFGLDFTEASSVAAADRLAGEPAPVPP